MVLAGPLQTAASGHPAIACCHQLWGVRVAAVTQRLDADPHLGALEQMLRCGDLLRASELRAVLVIQLPQHLQLVRRHCHSAGQGSCSSLEVFTDFYRHGRDELANSLPMIGRDLKTSQFILDTTTIRDRGPVQVGRQPTADLAHSRQTEQRHRSDTESGRRRARMARPRELAAERATCRTGHPDGGSAGKSAHTSDVGRLRAENVTPEQPGRAIQGVNELPIACEHWWFAAPIGKR